MLDQFLPCIQDLIENSIHVEANRNCGYCVIVALLGIGEDSWSLVHNHLLKELGQWSDKYIDLFGGIDRHEQSLLVDGLSMVYKFFCYVFMNKCFLMILIKIVTCK